MPIFHKNVIQGTTEWAQLRCGIPTASQFHRIVTPSLTTSKSAEMYLFELLAERLTGEPTVQYTSHWMDRGSELEAAAVDYYHFTTDLETEKIGFVTNDARTIGCSPDRLVGDKGLLQVKVPKLATHVGYLLRSGTAYKEHRIQVQGELWITECEWNDLLVQNPGLPSVLFRVERDEEFIEELATAVLAFSEELEKTYYQLAAALKAEGWVDAPNPRPEPTLVEQLRQSLIERNRNPDAP